VRSGRRNSGLALGRPELPRLADLDCNAGEPVVVVSVT
jgi:hypothetical protein